MIKMASDHTQKQSCPGNCRTEHQLMNFLSFEVPYREIIKGYATSIPYATADDASRRVHVERQGRQKNHSRESKRDCGKLYYWEYQFKLQCLCSKLINCINCNSLEHATSRADLE